MGFLSTLECFNVSFTHHVQFFTINRLKECFANRKFKVHFHVLSLQSFFRSQIMKFSHRFFRPIRCWIAHQLSDNETHSLSLITILSCLSSFFSSLFRLFQLCSRKTFYCNLMREWEEWQRGVEIANFCWFFKEITSRSEDNWNRRGCCKINRVKIFNLWNFGKKEN